MAKVMVVDDDAQTCKVLSKLLASAGYGTARACDGIDALERLPADQPDVILLDIDMPRMNGLAFLARLRENPEFADRRVIIMSAQDDPSTRQRAKALGAMAYLVKAWCTWQDVHNEITTALNQA